MSVSVSTDFDVLIAGGGLVGGSLAIAMASTNCRVGLVEAVPHDSQAQPSFDDRTIALSRGSCRILDGLGIWSKIADTVWNDVDRQISNYVRARDKGRCAVPGCRKPGVHFHHDKGWRNGHDPETGFSLCHSHHDARHRGYLGIEGSMPDAHFFLADGTCLGRAGDEERADSSSPGAAPAPRSVSVPEPAGGEPLSAATSPEEAAASDPPPTEAPPGAAPLLAPGISQAPAGAPNPVDDAVKALRKLGIDARGAERAVRSVLQLHPGRSWEAGELVRAALAGSLPRARAS